MNTFFPLTGSEADWNAAYYRLEDYFRALRVVNKVYQSQLILRILQSASARHARDVNQNPTTLAMEEARTAIDQWFETILGQRERIGAAGLIALLAADAPARWPVAFLSDDIPAELREELRENEVRAGPDLQVSSMVPRAIDVGQLLDPFHLSDALEKIRGAAFLALALAAISFSLFLLTR